MCMCVYMGMCVLRTCDVHVVCAWVCALYVHVCILWCVYAYVSSVCA